VSAVAKGLGELVLKYEPAGVAVLSGEELRVVYANLAARVMTGLGRGKEGERLDVLIPGVQTATLEWLREVIRRGEPAAITELENPAISTPEGGPTYWSIRCIPLERVDALMMFAQDVTEQVRVRRQIERQAWEADAARQALAEREALLQLALEAAEMAEFDWDLATGEVHHSATLAKIFGLPSKDGVARVELLLGLIHPDDLERFRQWSQGRFAKTKRVSHEFRLAPASGGLRSVALRAQVMRGKTGQPERMIGVIIDITEEHRLREQLEYTNRRLERFAGMVAHDLKSPLQTMVGFSRLLARSLAPRLTAQEREQLSLILDAGRQMGELVDGVLAHAFATRAEVPHEPVDLEQALVQVLDRLRLAITESKAQISHDSLPIVSGQPVLLTLVLQNLIANALKYCKGVPQLHVSAREDRAEWVIAVHDNGIGIAPEDQGRLFEAFKRAHAEDDYQGLGLGLSLVKDAVEHHGGRVWVDSSPGQGSSFYFSLPKTF
jgi:PAS domain S-box-containing protein